MYICNDNITLRIYGAKKKNDEEKVLPKINYHSAYNGYSVITNHDTNYITLM